MRADTKERIKSVGQPVMKKDAMSLVTGQPVYMDDLMMRDCLIVKVLRSPHANAVIQEINTAAAMKVPGIEAVYTWEDVPQRRFTMAGQTAPEPSPQDRLILDRHVRYVGDPVAIVAGADEACVDRALRMIKVKYEVLPAILDFHTAKDNEILVHPEENWVALCPVGADNKRNLVACETTEHGEVDKVMEDCDIVLERTYLTKANQQTMMEPFQTGCWIDPYGRLVVFSSTQIVFHARRIVAHALDIPTSKVRVSKPRIGGGFGAKQTVVAEIYPAFVTWMTKKPSKMIYSRYECQIASTPRHQMEVTVKLGADRNGKIRALDVYTLSNSGSYGEHGPTTVGLSGHKSIPLYTHSLEAHRFAYDVVYTNIMSAGAYRGYGATQGIYAVETTVNELASILDMDPVAVRSLNMVREGEVMPAYYNETADSCALDRCLKRASEMFEWDKKPMSWKTADGKIRGKGMALAMQGSGISAVDVGSATIKLNEDGIYTLIVGSGDMGTGSDTILAQMAADCLECPVENITVFSGDTDVSPYDSGSYASSTTYVTGMAVARAGAQLRERIESFAAALLGVTPEDVAFDGTQVVSLKDGKAVSLEQIGLKGMDGAKDALEVTVTHSSPTSPPPYMVGMAEVEIDPETGNTDLIDFVAVVDCGTVINENLARVQTEGGILQGIGMALSEDVQYSPEGKVRNNTFMQYKIPTRLDKGTIRVDFESSYEESGPFGAKSIGEIVIDTPSPAIVHAIHSATGLWFRELPVLPEKIAMGLLKNETES